MQNAALGQQGTPAYVVTLVHGTFAPGTPWTREGSELSQAIQKGLEGTVLFQQFRWEGEFLRCYNNTPRHRHEAAVKLRRHLKAMADQYPGARQFVVAHSHGGNVAIEALEGKELAGHIQGLACLATPFFTATRSSRDKYTANLADGIRKIGWLSYLILFGAVIRFVERTFSFLPLLLGRFVSPLSIFVLTEILDVIALTLWFGGAFATWRWGARLVTERLGPWLLRRQDQLMEQYAPHHLGGVPVFVACIERDEAMGVLRGERQLERGIVHVYCLLLLAVLFVALTFLVTTSVMWLVAGYQLLPTSSSHPSSTFPFLLTLVSVRFFVLFFVFIALMFPTIFLWPFIVGSVASVPRLFIYGPENPLENWLFKRDVAAMPSIHSSSKVLLKRYKSRCLRPHSIICEHTDMLKDLADWMRDPEQQKQTPI